MLIEGSLRLFGWSLYTFQVILEPSLAVLKFSGNALWMLNYCSLMLVQCSANAHLMLIQYSFVCSVIMLIEGSWRLFWWSLYMEG